MQQASPRVASLDHARLDKLLAAEADALARLNSARANLDTFRKAYSSAHGFKVNLSLEQVRRDMEFRA